MWTPAKAAQAARTTVLYHDERGLAWDIETIRCRGQGKAVAKRFTAFRCPVVYLSKGTAIQPDRRYRAVMLVKIRKIGRGSVCAGLGVVPSGCLGRGPRAVGSFAEVQRAIMRHEGTAIVNILRMTYHGSGFYLAHWRGPNGELRGSVTFGPRPVLKVLG